MRALVFLLIVANLSFLAWERGYFGASFSAGRVDSARQRQFMADRVNVVSRDEPPVTALAGGATTGGGASVVPSQEMPPAAATPAQVEEDSGKKDDSEGGSRGDLQSGSENPEPPPLASTEPEKVESPAKPAKPVPPVCLALNDLTSAELSRAREVVRGRFPEFKTESKTLAGSTTYWVFIPPMANRQEAERRSEELKKLNVPEFFILQEPPAMRFAISLGVFSTREAAMERHADLRTKGVSAARVGERETRPATHLLELRGPEPRANAVRQAISGALPKVRVASCKAR